MAAPIRFYFDFLSPYAYIACTQIHRIAGEPTVELVPVLFAGLLGHHGTKGPAEVPAKRSYLLFDTVRKARALGVPFDAPKHHPFNPLLALRVASVPMDRDAQRRLVDRLFAEVWTRRGHVEDVATVEGILAEVGLDPKRTIADATSDEGKARVRAQTERAISDGVFGVPTVVAGGEIFWGCDSLPDLERFLESGKPTLDPELIARWSALTPSAERKR